jgi:hypothetical protein
MSVGVDHRAAVAATASPSSGGEGGNSSEAGRKRRRRSSSPLPSPLVAASISSRRRHDNYEEGLEKATPKGEGGLHRWLEVGPGAMGTLSRLVLDADARNTLLAIEAVAGSARTLEAGLRAAYGDGKALLPLPPSSSSSSSSSPAVAAAPASPLRPPQPKRGGKAAAPVAAAATVTTPTPRGGVTGAGALLLPPSSSSPLPKPLPRFRIVQGLAGHVPLPPCPWGQEEEGGGGGVGYEALVAEVLGHLASSEGYVAILHQVRMGR